MCFCSYLCAHENFFIAYCVTISVFCILFFFFLLPLVFWVWNRGFYILCQKNFNKFQKSSLCIVFLPLLFSCCLFFPHTLLFSFIFFSIRSIPVLIISPQWLLLFSHFTCLSYHFFFQGAMTLFGDYKVTASANRKGKEKEEEEEEEDGWTSPTGIFTLFNQKQSWWLLEQCRHNP